MANILGLLEELSAERYQCDYVKAKATGTCIICKRSSMEFRDGSSKFEYSVSALCQDCQDDCFKGGR